jgi:hypothetical protein
MSWITAVLLVDADSTRWTQRGLGVCTWLVLVWLLRRESPLVRMQTAVVVVFASVIEYTFSPLLEVYTYRFDNVPMYVPPGHGLVYLAALAIGRLAWVQMHSRGLRCDLSRTPRRPWRLLVLVSCRLLGVGPVARALRRCLRRRHLSRARWYGVGHLGLATR